MEEFDLVKRLLKSPSQLFRSAFIAVVGGFSFYKIVKRVDHHFVFDFIPLIVVSIFAFLAFFWISYHDRKAYIMSKRKAEFIPSISGVSILIGLFITLQVLELRDKSPRKLFCISKMSDFNDVSIDFREDGTYKLIHGGLGTDFYRGSYTIQDSIITLAQANIREVLSSNRLVIRAEKTFHYVDSTQQMDTINQQSIYQIDDEGNIILSALEFVVIDRK